LLLTEEFLNTYPDAPEHMDELGSFVFYRTYSRWLPDMERRETWKEAVARAVEYNVSIGLEQLDKVDYKISDEQLERIRLEAQVLFDNVFNMRQFLSGRTHWVGGAQTGVANKFPLANFNCSFIDVKKWDDLGDLFYLLLVGTGVGFRCTQENAYNMPKVRVDYQLNHSIYRPVKKEERLEDTYIIDLGNGYVKIYIGDSKEGWVDALRHFFNIITSKNFDDVYHIKISYNSIRPKGERLKTFGGTASGHMPIKEMFEGIDKVLKGQLDDSLAPLDIVCPDEGCDEECDECDNDYSVWREVRPVHILDIGNLIGNNVVVGGVRRTAEIFICDNDDMESINAKWGLTPNLYHRFMSNNSIAFEEKPSREELHSIFNAIKHNGEPGFINMEAARKRRPNARGLNPCAEVILDSYGVCNLTTVNVLAFVKVVDGVPILDYSGLQQAQALSTRAGLRMTCLDLELTRWDKVQKRDRLIGASLTGWKDAIAKLGYDEQQEKNLLSALCENVHNETVMYCHILRIPTPLLSTTVKPEGTLSQVAGGVSSGLHKNFAPYYIRRIRINANDPLADVVKKLNWRIQPEVGSTWDDAQTLVIDFPVQSAEKAPRDQQTVEEQFNTYFTFQEEYTTHNSSITITVKDEEWEKAEEIVWENWDKIIGVTFLPFNGGEYELMPYEEISEDEYWRLKEEMLPFNAELLDEKEEIISDIYESCEDGACAVR